MTTSLSDEELQRMHMQLLELRTKNYNLGEKNVNIQAELLQNKQLLEETKKELAKCQKVISRSKNAKEIEQFVQENDILQQKLQTQEDEFRLQNETLTQEIYSLEAANEELKKEVQLTKTMCDVSSEFQNQDEKIKLEAEIAALKKVVAGCTAQKEGSADSSSVELDLKLNTALEENRLLQDNMKKMEGQYRAKLLEVENEIEKVSEKLKKKQESYLKLQEEKEKLYNEGKIAMDNFQTLKETEALQLKEQLKALQWDLKNALKFNETLSSDNIDPDAGATIELDGEKATFDCSLSESRVSLRNIQEKIMTLTKQLSDSESKVSVLEVEKEERCHKIEELERGQSESEIALSEMAKLAEKRKKMMDDMKEHLIETTNKQSMEIENLTRKLTEEQEAFKTLFDKEKETQVKLLEAKSEIQVLKDEIEKLHSSYCSADEKIRDLEEQMQTIIAEGEESFIQKDQKHVVELNEFKLKSETEIQDLKIQLEMVIAEKVEYEEKVKALQQEAKDSIDDRKIQEKKGLSMVKDLKRQLQVERNRAEKLQERLQEVLNEQNRSVDEILQTSSDKPKGDASSISSWSYVSGGTAEREIKDVTLHSDTSSGDHDSPNRISPTLLETETNNLLAKVAQLQQKNWTLEEKVNHLEISNEALVDDLLKKSALIQFYCMEGRSDPHTSVAQDKLTIKRVVDFIKDRGDENLREMNRRMQRMLEETLTKNMHLQKDIETLSNEVSRLSKLVISPTENGIQSTVFVDGI